MGACSATSKTTNTTVQKSVYINQNGSKSSLFSNNKISEKNEKPGIKFVIDNHAQKEIQEYATAMKELIKPFVPHVIEAFDNKND